MEQHMMSTNTPLEEGNPATEGRLFRRCLGQFGTGVAIITTQHEGQMAGATVNSVASVSLDPPLVLWSIGRTSRSFELFENAKGFVINILSKDQMELSRHFAGSATDKFAGLKTIPGHDGIPMIDGAIAHIECTNEASHDGGDHVIKIGRAVNVRRYDGDPLLFVQGRYVVPAEHPDLEVAPETPGASSDKGRASSKSLLSLVFNVYQLLSAKFDAHRSAEGVHLSVTRIMYALDETPDISLSALVRKTFLGVRDAEDTLAQMMAKGLVLQAPDGALRLSEAGYARREAIRRRWLQFEAEELSGISRPEIAAATDVLNRLWSKQ